MAQTLLAKQKIIQMSVTIEWLQKKHVEQEDWLYLYNSMIETPQGSYAIHDIFDISFKWQPDQIGYLYLHTASGVRTFHIKTDPLPFVDCFKKMQTPY
ncbi:hypothetical protein [Bacillus piscicola]|uniref:hypothetical protein n=1 Tax=Bacillus piscicola TaxID=1632684 RepID=UPI001F092116|nr:hypothetical protein [Bacillus piscicola]